MCKVGEFLKNKIICSPSCWSRPLSSVSQTLPLGNQWDLLIILLNTDPNCTGRIEQKWEGCMLPSSTLLNRSDFQSASRGAALSVEIVFSRKLFAILLRG